MYQNVRIQIAVVKNTGKKAIARKDIDIHTGLENIVQRLVLYQTVRKQQLLQLQPQLQPLQYRPLLRLLHLQQSMVS